MAEIVIRWYGGQCPNQVEGDVYGKLFYFRARHGRWALRIEGEVVSDGEDDEAGWWDDGETLVFAMRRLHEWIENEMGATVGITRWPIPRARAVSPYNEQPPNG